MNRVGIYIIYTYYKIGTSVYKYICMLFWYYKTTQNRKYHHKQPTTKQVPIITVWNLMLWYL